MRVGEPEQVWHDLPPPRILVILHEDHYPLGLFEKPLLARAGEVEVIQAVAGLRGTSIDTVDGLITLGGDIGAYDDDAFPFLRDELELLRQAHAASTPILGVCLGGQLLARTLGAQLRPQGCREVGWQPVEFVTRDPLLGPQGRRRRFLWHRDSFDLPPGAAPLARSERCWQAFRVGSSYGLQYHPEMSLGQARQLLGMRSSTLLGLTDAEREAIASPGPGVVEVERDAEVMIAAFVGACAHRSLMLS